jgi:uncharacterized RDD family membrane protein YckC
VRGAWYYLSENSEIEGPCEFTQLAYVLRAAPSGLNTLIWTEGMNDWERAAANPEILQRLNVPLPPRRNPPTAKPTESDYRVDQQLPFVQGDAPARIIPSRLVEVDKDEDAGDNPSTTLHPWRRFFARQIDLWFFVVALVFALEFFAKGSSSTLDKLFENNAIASAISVLMLIPVEAFFLGMFGTTLGKALYGISVRQESGEPLRLGQTVWRSFAVAFRGMAIGIPLLNLFTLYSAYKSLLKDSVTSWDKEGGFAVQHSRLGFFRIVLLVLSWSGIAALFVLGTALNK